MIPNTALQTVLKLVAEINRVIEHMPLKVQFDARAQVLATLATMPTEQSKCKLMEILEPGFQQIQGRV